jgi:membrane peptidoglycan carboxypeptidase
VGHSEDLYEKYGPDKFNLMDRGYLAHVHPLELWMLNYRGQHPKAVLSELISQSASQRQEAYQWLFRPHYKNPQDSRIRTILEEDAFKDIWKAWKQEGYPFDSLVPSFATAIGVSGDTPAALADLMGIMANGGMHYPGIAIHEIHIAQNTPVETVLQHQPATGQRVLSPEIVELVRQELIGVVERGTARRAQGGIVLSKGRIISVGGKTGTGDNRFKIFARGGGAPISSQAVNRTAAFAFLIGDRFFGTVLAFVPGKSAQDYDFTSALAVQIFKDLEPVIKPFIISSMNETPESKSAPARASAPVPTTAPELPPASEPAPEPAPVPEPGTEPTPAPEPAPATKPGTEPTPEPAPTPEPTPAPEPAPAPDPAPGPTTAPATVTAPVAARQQL